ncbi:hypothetical protein PCANC_02209 [Puccinia coronata f. sp. avenae]|uniref:Uncharacterized protein n=1 Tax=Puccinia coronata f. sp. avenae TaxID=200324 RepID=A0A2N5W0V4_9BASI|nr:hypothetical protein PCASD_26003 [Puccinia coronata f. sp. avenae]PLW55889.1 hypothetical protein PCANC_02209 [Puccinia coronata f. sp. avenae]
MNLQFGHNQHMINLLALMPQAQPPACLPVGQLMLPHPALSSSQHSLSSSLSSSTPLSIPPPPTNNGSTHILAHLPPPPFAFSLLAPPLPLDRPTNDWERCAPSAGSPTLPVPLSFAFSTSSPSLT